MGFEAEVSPRSRATPLTGIGLRALKGGAVVVGVAIEAGVPQILLSTTLATGDEDDRLSLEPYRAAVEMRPMGKVSPEKLALVAEGRRRQGHLT
jgi:hypothetical protein